MRLAILTSAAALSLAGCQTTDIDAGIQKSMPKLCAAAGVLYSTYVAANDTPSPKLVTAWAVLEPLCADPSTATATDLAIAAAQYAIIVKVMKDAK